MNRNRLFFIQFQNTNFLPSGMHDHNGEKWSKSHVELKDNFIDCIYRRMFIRGFFEQWVRYTRIDL